MEEAEKNPDLDMPDRFSEEGLVAEPGDIEKSPSVGKGTIDSIDDVLERFNASIATANYVAKQVQRFSLLPEYRPSLFARLVLFSRPGLLTSPTISELFPMDEVIAFLTHHNVEQDQLRSLREGKPYEDVVRGGLLERLWLWIRGFTPVGEPLLLDAKIPVMELHAPNVEGCKAVYTIEAATESNASILLTIGGVGAGGSVRTKITTTTEVPVSPSNCLGLVCNAKISVSRYEKVLTNQAITVIDVAEISNVAYPVLLRNYPVSIEAHICYDEDAYSILEKKIELMHLTLGRHYDTSSPEAVFDTALKIEKESIYSVKWTVPGPDGEQLGLEASSKVMNKAEGKFTLSPYYKYIATMRDRDQLPWVWAAIPT